MNNNRIPRPEYPRPQFKRNTWQNLNGEWDYHTDHGKSGEMRSFFNAGVPNTPPMRENGIFTEKIIVPFCRESELSGIGDKDFCECVWYRKTVNITEEWLNNRKTILNIGACDYKTRVWVNGKYIGEHIGGYVAFSFDITDALVLGDNIITIEALDDVRSGKQPAGKQCRKYYSYGCSYTRTTGIWQTVWLENTPCDYIESAKYYPNIQSGKLLIRVSTVGGENMTVSARATYEGKEVGKASAVVRGGKATLEIELSELHLWEVLNAKIYDLELNLGDDTVYSYFGMREVSVKDGILYINGKKIFQRLILDQGFYPDGIYTARDVLELEKDVDRSIDLGFNGARLHQKVFEPLFLEFCDRKGYIVWGEHANWCLKTGKESVFAGFLPEWCEILKRDFNHPAIVGWCPLNETDPDTDYNFHKLLETVTKNYDDTRAYIDTSGWYHFLGCGDIMDIHDYTQDPAVLAERLAPLAEGGTYDVHARFGKKHSLPIHATFVSEYGGIRWAPEIEGWGYGEAPKTPEEFLERFKALTEVIMQNPVMGGLCYTQLTDVEQEVNGLYTYGRELKFPAHYFKEVLTKKAAIEE